MLTKRLGVLGVLLMALALGAPEARAANPSDEGCNQDDECRGHFVKGKALYKQQDYTGALKEFQVAYERRQTPILLINMGRTMQKLGRPKEALDYYVRCQEAAKSDEELQQKLTLYIAETKALLASSAPSTADTKATDPDAEPAPAALTAPLTPVEKKKPIYKKGWFWAAVIGGAAVVAGAVVVGVVLGTKPSPDPPLDPGVTVIRPMF